MVTIEETSFASSSMKIHIFDGMDRSKYQDWNDNLFAILQFSDLEEYIESGWKDKDILGK